MHTLTPLARESFHQTSTYPRDAPISARPPRTIPDLRSMKAYLCAYLILVLDGALLRSVAEVPVEFEMRLPARVRGSGLRTKNTRLGSRRGVAQER